MEPNTTFEGEVASTVAARKNKRRPAPKEDEGNNAQAGVPTTGSSQGQRQTLSNREVESQESANARRSSINIQDLSFILHPAHEASTPEEKNTTPRSAGDGLDNERTFMLNRASYALSVRPDTLERM